jgi:hypothetical protein
LKRQICLLKTQISKGKFAFWWFIFEINLCFAQLICVLPNNLCFVQ